MSLQLVMMGLGAFRFGAHYESYQSLQRTASYRWHKSERIGRAPAMQYVGEDAQEITLGGVIYPHYRGGTYQMELMRRQAKRGQPLFMVDIQGYNWQRWVILRVDERQSLYTKHGTPRQIEFQIDLQSYGEDQGLFTALTQEVLS